MRKLLSWFCFVGVAVTSLAAPRVEVIWPTPNKAFDEGKPIADFLQQAGSGDPASGGFGGVRSGGRQFHEGLDIQPVEPRRHGEPTDSVFAALDGVVRHINAVAGKSSYGRYIVLEHPGVTPAIYTLYAHLAKIDSGISEGSQVQRGQTLGVMGRSATYVIPRSRAHLHFEMGLRLTNDFQTWYDRQGFGSRNDHGVYNGMNLGGFDPLDFFRDYKRGTVTNFQQYLAQLPIVVTLRIATSQRPDFVDRYPSLVTKHLPMLIKGWKISFTWNGLPVRWTPLDATEVQGMRRNEVQITQVNEALDRQDHSRRLAVSRHGKWIPADDLETTLQLLFGLK